MLFGPCICIPHRGEGNAIEGVGFVFNMWEYEVSDMPWVLAQYVDGCSGWGPESRRVFVLEV